MKLNNGSKENFSFLPKTNFISVILMMALKENVYRFMKF